jgi:hypothetical protein
MAKEEEDKGRTHAWRSVLIPQFPLRNLVASDEDFVLAVKNWKKLVVASSSSELIPPHPKDMAELLNIKTMNDNRRKKGGKKATLRGEGTERKNVSMWEKAVSKGEHHLCLQEAPMKSYRMRVIVESLKEMEQR